MGVYEAARQLGLRIPEDLSVVGFDDIRLAAFFNPPLTTVAQPHREMGVLAIRLLLERIADRNLPVRSPLLPTTLKLRSSTAPVSENEDRRR